VISGAIHAWVAEIAKAKFLELHDALAKSAKRVESLRVRQSETETELRNVKAKETPGEAAATGDQSTETTTQCELTDQEEQMIDRMVDDARHAEDEADGAETRLLKLDTRLYDLTKRRDALRKQKVRIGAFPNPSTHCFTEAGDCCPYIAIYYKTDTFLLKNERGKPRRNTNRPWRPCFQNFARRRLRCGTELNATRLRWGTPARKGMGSKTPWTRFWLSAKPSMTSYSRKLKFRENCKASRRS